MSVELALSFEVIYCCNCGVPFAIPGRLRSVLLETHRLFYCPNGHTQSFTGETEAERLKRELARVNLCRENTQLELEAALRSEKRLRSRIAKGICPCCNRSFANLKSHMETKHKGYHLPEGDKKKQISGTVQ